MSTSKHALTAGIAMLSRASNQASMIILTLTATRYLTPALFGAYAIAAAFVTLSRTMLYTGPFEYQMKATDLDAVATECLLTNFALASAWCVVLVGIGFAAPVIFSSTVVATLAFSLAPSNFFAALASWQESLLLRSGNLRRYYIVTVVVEYSCVAGALVLFHLGFGLMALVAQVYVRLILLAITYRTMVAWPRLRRPVKQTLYQVMRWSSARYSSVTISFASNYSGDLILGVVLSPTATGMFRASNRVVTAVSDLFAQPASVMSMTSLARSRAQGDPPSGRWITAWSGVAVGGLPALAGLAILSNVLTPLALGPKWAGAAPIISILCLARMFTLGNTTCSSMLVVYDEQAYILRSQIFLTLANAGLTLLVAHYGVAAVAGVQIIIAASSMTLVGRKAFQLGGVDGRDWGNAALVVAVPLAATVAGTILSLLCLRPLGLPRIELIVCVVTAGLSGWILAVLALRQSVTRALLTLSAGTARQEPA